MYKIKTRFTKDGNKLIVKLSRDEIINNRDISYLFQSNNANLMKVIRTKKSVIEYVADQSVSLATYFSSQHTKHEFYLIVEQMLCFFRGLQKTELSINNILLDFRYIYIDLHMNKILFVYLPIVSNHILVDIKGFFDSVTNMFLPMHGERIDYIQQFCQFLKKLDVFDFDIVERFILAQDKTVREAVRRITVSQSGFITDKKQELLNYRDRFQNIQGCAEGNVQQYMDLEKQQNIFQNQYDEETSLLEDNENGYSNDGTMLLEGSDFFDDNEGTIILGNQDNYEEGTTLLGVENNSIAHYATLTRIKNSEVITLNKPVFRLGKVKDFVDYFINDNNAISRSHADIVTRGNRYFVSDQNSTNHTFINGVLLPPIQETEICDGDTLKLADEEFIFNI